MDSKHSSVHLVGLALAGAVVVLSHGSASAAPVSLISDFRFNRVDTVNYCPGCGENGEDLWYPLNEIEEAPTAFVPWVSQLNYAPSGVLGSGEQDSSAAAMHYEASGSGHADVGSFDFAEGRSYYRADFRVDELVHYALDASLLLSAPASENGFVVLQSVTRQRPVEILDALAVDPGGGQASLQATGWLSPGDYFISGHARSSAFAFAFVDPSFALELTLHEAAAVPALSGPMLAVLVGLVGAAGYRLQRLPRREPA